MEPQATLSRDIRELGLIKTADGYAAPGDFVADAAPPAPELEHILREFVTDVREAQNLLVVKTAVGSAQPVAVAWDTESWSDVVGTVAGDDTILVICPDKRAAHRVAARLRGMLA